MFTTTLLRPLLLAVTVPAGLLALLVFTYSAIAQNSGTGDQPRNLRIESTESGMLLTWDAPAEDAESVTSYRIKRRKPDKYRRLFVLVPDTGSTETTYLDTTTRNNVRYVYRVHALRGGEVSTESNFAVKRYRSPATPTATSTPTPTATSTPTPTATSTPTPTATSTPTPTATPTPPATATPTATSTPTPTATPTPPATATPTATSTPTPESRDAGSDKGGRSPAPGNSGDDPDAPKKEDPPIPDDPPRAVRQVGSDEDGRILVDNSSAIESFESHQSHDVSAQGFTTGSAPYTLTGIEMTIYYFDSTQDLSFSVSEATSTGEPGEPIYELEFDAPDSQDQITLFLAAPEEANLKPNTEYFIHIDGGFVLLYKITSTAEDDTGLADWSIADGHWSYDGASWTSSSAFVYEITVRGEELNSPDAEGSNSSTAVRLAYSRAAGESFYVVASLDNATDVDWFKTNLSFDVGARYRIDIDPVSLTNDDDLRVRAFYVDYPYAHSRDDFLGLEKLTDPPEGLISYYVTVTRNYGPYIKVSADNGTVGDYRIRIVYDPIKTWDGSEVLKGDLPHDDTTWAAAAVGTTQTGVYHYYDDHDWFEIEFVEDETYVILTIPPDSWVAVPDIGTVVKLYDSGGNELEVDYANSRVGNAIISYTVPTGEGGTYYIDVSYANFQDDPDVLDALGLTEGFESGSSPFIGSKYHFTVSQQN